jgi:ABC-type Na+ efflux pump permease subunit
LRERLVVTRRELASLRAEKTVLLAVAIQLFVAAFSSFLVVGLVALYAPGAAGGSATVVVAVSGNASDELAPVIEEGPTREALTYTSRSAARDALEGGRADAAVHATLRPAGNVSVEAVVPEGSFRTTLAVAELAEAFEAFERERRADLAERLERTPLPVPESSGGSFVGFTYTVLLPLLVFLPVFISGSVAVDSLSEELERGTFELLRVTPLSVPEIVDGKALASATLVPVQVAAWLALLSLNGVRVAAPLATVLLAAGFGALAVAVGSALALLVPERRSAQLLYSVVVLAGFSGALFLPVSPPNAVARLAIGSAGAGTYALLAGVLALAAGGYAGVRVLLGRRGVA